MKGPEGYLLIENPEHVPFGDPSAALRSGKVWVIPPRTVSLYENSTITCNHCQQVFLKNSHRKRDREWCWSCDRYVCDRCAAVRAVVGCQTFAALADQEVRVIG